MVIQSCRCLKPDLSWQTLPQPRKQIAFLAQRTTLERRIKPSRREKISPPKRHVAPDYVHHSAGLSSIVGAKGESTVAYLRKRRHICTLVAILTDPPNDCQGSRLFLVGQTVCFHSLCIGCHVIIEEDHDTPACLRYAEIPRSW
jgi:hypothetical protein